MISPRDQGQQLNNVFILLACDWLVFSNIHCNSFNSALETLEGSPEKMGGAEQIIQHRIVTFRKVAVVNQQCAHFS